MKISYKKLWKLLIDKELNKKQLAEFSGISQSMANKMTHGDNVNTETLVKICTGHTPFFSRNRIIEKFKIEFK